MESNELVDIKQSTISYLDKIKQRDSKGFDYWYARDLQKLLGYIEWRKFKDAIQRARMACESSGGIPSHHFGDTANMIALGHGAIREVEDVVLTRYACYLIAMNGDTSKPEIGIAQTYFAVQTRKQELAEQNNEFQDRLVLRDRVRDANKDLNRAAKSVGVENYGFFHDAGYQGLYGLRLSEIKNKKGIDPREDLLDRAGRAELAANEFRITQTELRLGSQEVNGQKQAENVHNYVGKEVRQTIQKLSGTMPEDLPPAPNIKQLKKQRKQKELPPAP
jgi:DNA-damage-inducible protein D